LFAFISSLGVLFSFLVGGSSAGAGIKKLVQKKEKG